ncbi:D-alanyl-D-alanine carboxypeptidase [Cytobacillus sp. Sa5YUA1]|uniref:D-alanyl-D-alanine carboxypeptidase n=1 Tax=Cytobacillus stercorigallinarum TaxID=2762240 RepID=A0ABR8QKH1_9BACI|nr:D-alanyl-D-alanine carboxypeptidase family protein [Cytobacillus stercorigallinarum]MBD7936016.1 D-alanyl-D-alanine carboxypeptidase [Cytobacillus stercorigallinarum]
MKKWKKLITFLIMFTLLLSLSPQLVEAKPSVSARNAVLIEQESGRIIYDKAANDQNRIASITKIMTAILAIESNKLEEKVKVTDTILKAEGSSIYLKPGEEIKLEDLVYGLMLRSGNDAAVAIAEYVGGSLDGFVYLMNQKAEEIGMTNTHFENPHGLDDHENHYSTAYDMALLTRYAMRNETYQEIAGTKSYRSENRDYSWNNKNRLLTQLYKYTTGGKTGYTKRAKRTLVTTATKNNLDLIAVTLNGPDDWNDHIAMYEGAFDQYDQVEVVSEGKIKGVDYSFYKNKVSLRSSFSYPVTEKEKEAFRVKYNFVEPKESWKSGEEVPVVVGKAVIYLNDESIKTMPIYYNQQGAKTEKGSFLDYFKNLFISILGVQPHD